MKSFTITGPGVDSRAPTGGSAISKAQYLADRPDRHEDITLYVRHPDGRPLAIVERHGRTVVTRLTQGGGRP